MTPKINYLSLTKKCPLIKGLQECQKLVIHMEVIKS